MAFSSPTCQPSRSMEGRCLEAHVNYSVPVMLPGMTRMESEDYEFRNGSVEKYDFFRCRRINEPFVSSVAIRKC